MKANQYRCSGCNEIKNSKTNMIMRVWAFKSKDKSTYGICRACNYLMRFQNIKDVKHLTKW